LRAAQKIAFLRSLLLLSFGLLAIVAGCGGDDGRPREEVKSALTDYFDQYLAVHQDVNGKIVALKTKYPQNYLDASEKSAADIQQTKDAYREYVALFDEFDNRVRSLNPPGEISDLVRQVLEADQAVSAINHDRLSKLEAVTTVAEVGPIFADNPAYTSAVSRTVELCTNMTERASEYDYELDLPCRG
jgi:hypothetical protein